MQIGTIELGKRIYAARESVKTDNGKIIGQGRFLKNIDPEESLGINQSLLSAIERGQGRVSQERLKELAEKVGVEVPDLVNGTGSEVLQNLASRETREAPTQAVARHFGVQTRPYPTHPVINALDHCAREIEALPDAATRGLVVDVLLRLYVEPYIKEHKE